MLKKRLIFALLWDSGHFCLSRNFRLQRIGNREWLTDQYHFASVANSIDELLVLDVTRGLRLSEDFLAAVSELATTIQVPISAGGGVRDPSSVQRLLRSGADKVVCNSAFVGPHSLLEAIRDRFGQQSIVGSVDVVRADFGYRVMLENGTVPAGPLGPFVEENVRPFAGELLINSIDRDGTGQGLDFAIPSALPDGLEQPVILMGGTGKPDHIVEGLSQPHVDAVATSNLLNFIGDGLAMARAACALAGVPIPRRLPVADEVYGWEYRSSDNGLPIGE